MALYKIKDPIIRKLALVKEPASGNRWFLFKQLAARAAPDVDGAVEMVKSASEPAAVLAGFVQSLTPEEARAVSWELKFREDMEAKVAELKRQHEEQAAVRRGVETLAKGSPGEQLAALAEYGERQQIAQRAARINAELRAENRAAPKDRHGTSWLTDDPLRGTATGEEAADMVMRLRQRDPGARKPLSGGF